MNLPFSLYIISLVLLIRVSTLVLQAQIDETLIPRGPHHEVTIGVNNLRSADGEMRAVTNRYVELADGLNRQDERGMWVRSIPRFRLKEGWAISDECQHRVEIRLRSGKRGEVTMTMPDGRSLRSQVFGICYFDMATGESVLLAEARERVGRIQSADQILFPDAFDDLRADLRYTVSLNGFEQDVIFREPLPSPEEFGLDPESTKLEVLTEFMESPVPRRQSRSIRRLPTPKVSVPVEAEFVDETLHFGSMVMGPGRVFDLLNESETIAGVCKRWMKFDQRDFLVESVAYSEVRELLNALDSKPGAGRSTRPRSPGWWNGREICFDPSLRPFLSSPRSILPAVELEDGPGPSHSTTSSELADASPPDDPGVVLDYVITLTPAQTVTRFRSDTTYFVSGPVTVYGAVFEGGTVLKYAPGTSLTVEASITDESNRYRPVVFTAVSDDSVGEAVALGSATFPRPTPTGSFGAPCLWVKGVDSGSFYPAILNSSNFRFAHASVGLRVQGFSGHVLRNSQFRDCVTAVELIGTISDAGSFSLLNGLVVRCTNALNASGPWVSLRAHHLTAARVGTFRNGTVHGMMEVRNSLFVGVNRVTGVATNSSFGNSIDPWTDNTFLHSGFAGFYLPEASAHARSCSATGVDSALVRDFRSLTTQAPFVLSGLASGSTTLNRVVRRDSDPMKMDRGYHYPALDYLLSAVRIDGGTIRVMPGVALGAQGPSGILLGVHGALSLEGTADSPVNLVRLQSVQECTSLSNAGPFRMTPESLVQMVPDSSTTRFLATNANLATLAGTGDLIVGNSTIGTVAAVHSQWFGGGIRLAGTSMTGGSILMENCLLQGVAVRFGTGSNSLSARVRHSTIHESALELSPGQGTDWELRDSILSDMEFRTNGTPVRMFNNAFSRATNVASSGLRSLINATTLPGSNSMVLSSVGWARGPLGLHYYTTGALRDRGSRTASVAGLYHHTTHPSQAKELDTLVDLGFHYIATTNGIPIDSDGDGISDIAEDLNGNGRLDAAMPEPNDIQETTFHQIDTDGDGYSDSEELSRGSNPRSQDLVPETTLARWRFDNPTWASEEGDLPRSGAVATSDTLSWDGNAANIRILPSVGTTAPVYQWLGYNAQRSDGSLLLQPNQGSVQFWFKPNWSSRILGTPEDGFNQSRKLITVQASGDESEVWGLELNASGTVATFQVVRNGSVSANSISWSVQMVKGNWYMLTLTYGAEGSHLWMNDQRLTRLTGAISSMDWPSTAMANKRVWIGGWDFSAMPRTANGSFENLRMFNRILSASAIQGHYRQALRQDTDGDGLSDLVELRTPGFSAGNWDSDADGLPDKWEFDNFGNNVAKPHEDPDQDGVQNLNEYIQNRLPLVRDSQWIDSVGTQTVRLPQDLVNLDFVTPDRLSSSASGMVTFGPGSWSTIISTRDSTAELPTPGQDQWNLVGSVGLRAMAVGSGALVIRNVVGGVTPIRLQATFGPMRRWIGGTCTSDVLRRMGVVNPTVRPDFIDGGIVAGLTVVSPLDPPWEDCVPRIQGASDEYGLRPVGPPVVPEPWTPPPWLWIGSSVYEFRPPCSSIGRWLPPLRTVPIDPLIPASNSSGVGGLLPGSHVSSDTPTETHLPSCVGTQEVFFRPAFQQGVRFINGADDLTRRHVTTHPMFQDYLVTPEESRTWRMELEGSGVDIRSARSTLLITGLEMGVWRVLVYSATQSDQRHCIISLKSNVASGASLGHGNVLGDSNATFGTESGSRVQVSSSHGRILPGTRRTESFLVGRHYIQETLDVGSDGMIEVQFNDHSAINGIQLLRLRDLEGAIWKGPIEENPAMGLILRWGSVPTATSYSVQRADSAQGPWTTLASDLLTTNFRDLTATVHPTGLPRTYWYRIQASNERFLSWSEPAMGIRSAVFSGNRPPILSRILPLGPVFERNSLSMSGSVLRSKAVAEDFEGASLDFRIERLLNGRLNVDGLEITEGMLASTVMTNPVRFVIRPGMSVTWASEDGIPGLVPAIVVRAFDGNRFSDQTAIVSVEVRASNQVVWWGSNLGSAAGSGMGVDWERLRSKYPGTWRYVRSDPEYWSHRPAAVSGPVEGRLKDVLQLVAGTGVTLALRGDGSLWSWGAGHANLGMGNPGCPTSALSCDLPWYVEAPVISPRQIQFPSDSASIQQVSMGVGHAVAVDNDGRVHLWGANLPLSEGMHDPDTVVMNVLPGEALVNATRLGRYNPQSLEQTQQATDLLARGTGIPRKVPGISDAVMTASSDHAVAVLLRDGTVLDWGTLTYFDSREFRSGPGGAISFQGGHRRLLNNENPSVRSFPSQVVQIAAGSNFFIALLNSGEVYVWGAADTGAFADPSWIFDVTDKDTVGTITPRRVPGLMGIRSIAASGQTAMALSKDGRIYEWGRSTSSGLINRTVRHILELPPADRIFVTESQAFAVDRSGRVWGWGENGSFGSMDEYSWRTGLLVPESRSERLERPVLLGYLEGATGFASAQSGLLHAAVKPRARAPEGLIAIGGDSDVTLMWNHFPGASAYHLYRSGMGTTADVFIGSSPATTEPTQTWIDRSVSNGSNYFYRVTAWLGDKESPSSPPVWAKPETIPVAVVGFQLESKSRSLGLRWCPTPGAVKYVIWRAGPYDTNPAVVAEKDYRIAYELEEQELRASLTGTADCNTNSFQVLDAMLIPDKWYAYRMVARNPAAVGPRVERRQKVGSTTIAPPNPMVTSVQQRGSIAVVQFQTNHAALATTWFVHLFHHQNLIPTTPCSPGSMFVQPASSDSGWVLDRRVALADEAGSFGGRMALGMGATPASRQLLIEGISPGIWQKVVILTQTPDGISHEQTADGGNSWVFRTLNPGASPIEPIISASGPGYIYFRYRNQAGFAPTTLTPKPLPCVDGLPSSVDESQCHSFTEFPWNDSDGETETWILNLPSLPSTQKYQVRIEPGSSATPGQSLVSEFAVAPRSDSDPFEIRVESKDGGVRLEWYSEEIATVYAGRKFVVERIAASENSGQLPDSCSPSISWRLIQHGTGFVCEDTGLINGTAYQYRVIALNPETGELSWSVTAPVVPQPVVSATSMATWKGRFLAKPKNGSVELQWAPLTGLRADISEIRYSIIHSKIEGVDGATLHERTYARSDHPDSSIILHHIDQPRENGLRRYYRLKVTLDNYEEVLSDWISAAPSVKAPPSTPKQLSIRKIQELDASRRFLLRWEPISGAVSYKIYVRSIGGSECLTSFKSGRTHWEYSPPATLGSSDVEFYVTAIGTDGLESEGVSCSATSFRRAQEFGAVASENSRLAPDDAEFIDLVLPVFGDASLARVWTPTNITLRASLGFSGQPIRGVEFYANDEWIGYSGAAPYAFEWINPPSSSAAGHRLAAVAVLMDGRKKSSLERRLMVGVRPPLSQFEHSEVDYILKTPGGPFRIERRYRSQADSEGILGKNWLFSFEQAVVLAPDLASDWQLVASGFGEVNRVVQEAGRSHEIRVILPDGGTKRFAVVPRLVHAISRQELEWAPLFQDTEEAADSVVVEFVCLDGSGARLEADESDLIQLEVHKTTLSGGNRLIGCSLRRNGQPFQPRRFVMQLSNGARYEYRLEDPSWVAPRVRALTLTQMTDQNGGILRIVTQRGDRSEVVGVPWSHVDVRRIALQALSRSKQIVRECWLDRVTGAASGWLFYDSVAVDSAITAAATNAVATLPGSVAAPAVIRYWKTANRLEQVDRLKHRTSAGYDSSRMNYKLYPGNAVTGVPAQELLTELFSPEGIQVVKNEYELGDRLYLLRSQELSSGMRRTFGRETPGVVRSTNIHGDNAGWTETVRYGSNGEITEIRDGTGVGREQVFDNEGRLSYSAVLSTNSAEAPLVRNSFRYSEWNQPTEISNGEGNTQRLEYDNDLRLTAWVDAKGNTTSIGYMTPSSDVTGTLSDVPGRVVKPTGEVVEYQYNKRGQVTLERRRLPGVTQLTLTRYEYYEDWTPWGRTGDLRRVYSPMAEACRSAEASLPVALQPYVTEYTYDANGNVATSTILRTIRMVTRDASGNLVEVPRMEALTTVSTYDPANRPVEVARWRRLLDATGQSVPGTEQLLDKQWSRYAPSGQELSSTDGQNRRTHKLFNAGAQLIQTTYPDGTVSRQTYDEFGRIHLVQERVRGPMESTGVDPVRGTTVAPATEYIYDTAGRVVYQHRRANVSLVIELDTTYRGFASANPPQFACRNATPLTLWNTNRHSSTRTHFDSFGRTWVQIDALGGLVETIYDRASRKIASRACISGTFSHSDSTVQLAGHTFQTSGWGYDGNGNVAWTRTPIQYPVPGQRIDSLQQTEFGYNSSNQRVTTHFPSVNGTRATIRTEYDASGNVVAEIAEDGVVTGYGYDRLGRLTSVIRDLNPTLGDAQQTHLTRYDYDEVGNVIAQVDEMGRTTRFEYDGMGRRTHRILPGGSLRSPLGSGSIELTEYRFVPESGSVDSPLVLQRVVTGFGGSMVEALYDRMDRVKQLVTRPKPGDPLLTRIEYEYNDWGAEQRIQEFVTAASTNSPSRSTGYEYHSSSRQLLRRSTPEGEITYGYDRKNQLTRMISHIGSQFSGGVAYDYDVIGRLKRVRQLATSGDETGSELVRYDYDLNGNPIRKELVNGVLTLLTFDPRNRLERMVSKRGSELSGPEIARFDYNPPERPLSVTGHRQVALESFAGLTTQFAVASGSARSRRVEYTYDRLRRLRFEDVKVGPAGLTGMLGTVGNVSYHLDKVGNRIQRVPSLSLSIVLPPQGPMVFDLGDHVDSDSSPASRSLWYDGNGNATHDPIGPAVAVATGDVYDARDRLVRRNLPNPAPSLEFVYDSDGNRVAKRTRTATATNEVRYLVDDRNPTGLAQILAEWTVTSSGTNILRTYYYGADRLCQQDGPTGSNRRFFGTDALGSTRYLTDSNGIPTHLFQFDAFGGLITHLRWLPGTPTTGTWSPAPSGTSPPTSYLYAGEFWDADLKLSYNRARYYDPKHGRFQSMDSFEGRLSDPGSLHKYLYAHGDPINNSDPSGKETLLSVSVASTIGNSLHSNYDSGVSTTGFALADTISGISDGKASDEIIHDYWFNTALGLGIGVSIGKLAQLADNLIYGGEIARSGTSVRRMLHAVFSADDLWKVSGGLPWSLAQSEVALAGAQLARGSRIAGSRNIPGSKKIVISASDVVNGEVNRIMLAEEIQHVWDGSSHQATRAIRMGRTLEEFHAEVFERVVANWEAGKLKFLVPEDIEVLKSHIIPFLKRRVL